MKVEMRHICASQEDGKVGGIGSCGRELCCSTWLTDFKSVNTTAARYQNLSINQTKLSGQCGRLKCCLNYELDTYLDALQYFPDNADVIHTTKSAAYLIKKDIFKNLMWYSLPESSKHYPLTIERVKEIQKMNAQGLKPDELEPVEVVSTRPKEVEPEFVDVVGHISLRSLERNSRKRHDKEKDNRANNDRRGNEHSKSASQPPNKSSQNSPNRQGPKPQRNQPIQKTNNAGRNFKGNPNQRDAASKNDRSPQSRQHLPPQRGNLNQPLKGEATGDIIPPDKQ